MQNGLLPAEYVWCPLFEVLEAWLRKCGHTMALAGAPGPCLSANFCWAQLSPAQPSLLTYQAGVQPSKAPQGLQDLVRDKAGLLCPLPKPCTVVFNGRWETVWPTPLGYLAVSRLFFKLFFSVFEIRFYLFTYSFIWLCLVLVVAHRIILCHVGSFVAMHRPSSCGVQTQLLHSM